MNSCNTSDEDSCNTCYASCLSRVIRRTVNDQVAALEQSILARTTGTDLEGKKGCADFSFYSGAHRISEGARLDVNVH